MQGGWLIQALAFCVHKWIHSHGAQGVIGPDGFFYDWFDGPVSKHGDRYFATESRVNETLTQLQLGELIQYIIYGDKGYTAKSHMLCSHHGPAFVTPQMDNDNWVMSRQRIGVEWGFGHVLERCPLLNRHKMFKLRMIDVSMYVRSKCCIPYQHPYLPAPVKMR